MNHRSFPAFTGFIAALGGGALLVWIGMLTNSRGLTMAGGLAVIVGVLVFVPIWIMVNAVNRPRFLVPPARRQDDGWWGEWRGWVGAPIGRDEAHPEPEESARAEAKTHSSTMTGPRRPLG